MVDCACFCLAVARPVINDFIMKVTSQHRLRIGSIRNLLLIYRLLVVFCLSHGRVGRDGD